MKPKAGRIGPGAVDHPAQVSFTLRGSIGRIENPSPAAFLKRYVQRNRPVLISGALSHWKALSHWSDAYLTQTAGACQAEVIASTNGLFPDYITKPEPMAKVQMTLGEFLERASGAAGHPPILAPGEALYVYGKPGLFQEVPALKEDVPKPEFLAGIDTNPTAMWMSTVGCITPLHYDLINGLLCQVRGRKLIYFFSPDQDALLYPRGNRFPGMDNFERQSGLDIHCPDEAAFPHFRQATAQKCILEPGDVLFIPSNWYHEVETLEDSISIGFNFAGGTSTSEFAAMADAFKSGNPPTMDSIQQQLLQNPQLMAELMKSPMFQQLMENPELLQQLMKGKRP